MHIARCQHHHINQCLQLQHVASAILWIPATRHHVPVGGCQERDTDPLGGIRQTRQRTCSLCSPQHRASGTYNPAHCPAVLLLPPKTHPLYDLPPEFLCAFSSFPISLKRRWFSAILFSLSISKASHHLLCCLFLSVPPSSTVTAGLTMLHLALRSFTKAVCSARFTTNAACNPRGTSFIPAPHPPEILAVNTDIKGTWRQNFSHF